MIENRINPPQESPAEGRETVRKKVVQGIALIDASNFHSTALFCRMHNFLFEALAELFLELLLQPLDLALERRHSFLEWRPWGRRRGILELHSPPE